MSTYHTNDERRSFLNGLGGATPRVPAEAPCEQCGFDERYTHRYTRTCPWCGGRRGPSVADMRGENAVAVA
jgi:Zn finger protein HypA/HybF involved in hydrogenase expression